MWPASECLCGIIQIPVDTKCCVQRKKLPQVGGIGEFFLGHTAEELTHKKLPWRNRASRDMHIKTKSIDLEISMNFSAVPRKILEFMQFYHYRIFAITLQTGTRDVSNNENTSLQTQSGSCSPCLDICVEPYIVSRSRKASQHRCVTALLHTDAFLQYHTQH